VFKVKKELLAHGEQVKAWGKVQKNWRTIENPRIGLITFHTFRHWKATIEYHKTKDILHFIRYLDIETSTKLFVILNSLRLKMTNSFQKLLVLLRKLVLLLSGYEYVTEFPNERIKIFKKRK
jgi:hypothetical protein